MLSEAPFRSYPLLTPEEFHEVCHHLDRRYCHATLGPARRRWKLRVCTALNTSGPAAAAFALGPEYSTYLQIVRPLEGELDDGDLSACLDNFSFGDGGGVDGEVEMEVDGGGERDREMMEAEEADRVCTSISCHDVVCFVKKKIPTDKTQQRLYCHHHPRRRHQRSIILQPLGMATATSGMRSTSTQHTRRPACGSACTTCLPTSRSRRCTSTPSLGGSCRSSTRKGCEAA